MDQYNCRLHQLYTYITIYENNNKLNSIFITRGWDPGGGSKDSKSSSKDPREKKSTGIFNVK